MAEARFPLAPAATFTISRGKGIPARPRFSRAQVTEMNLKTTPTSAGIGPAELGAAKALEDVAISIDLGNLHC